MTLSGAWTIGRLHERLAQSGLLSAQRAAPHTAHTCTAASRAVARCHQSSRCVSSGHQRHHSEVQPHSSSSDAVRPPRISARLPYHSQVRRTRITSSTACSAASDDWASFSDRQPQLSVLSDNTSCSDSSGSDADIPLPDAWPTGVEGTQVMKVTGLQDVAPAAAEAQTAQYQRDRAVEALRRSGRSVPTTFADVHSLDGASFDEFDHAVSCGGRAVPCGYGREVEEVADELPQKEKERRLNKAVQYLQRLHKTKPADPKSNRALTIWKAIRDVPAAIRYRLLDKISPSDITRLWRTSLQRGKLDSPEAVGAVGSLYSQWDDFPAAPGEVSVFEGRAVLPRLLSGPASLLRADRFRKLFFLHPDSEELMGRVDVGYGALGRKLYPLYFLADIEPSIVPVMYHLADMRLNYVEEPCSLTLAKKDLPDDSWPRPKPPMWPFNGGLTDYMRAVGPGVYVGVGWHGPRPEWGQPARPFLPFMLVRRPQ